MLKIKQQYLTGILSADRITDLHPFLQKAIELEHSTIPPYLTAMISLKPGTNRGTWNLLHSVVIEEMLHLSIAANILNALNGKPVLDNKGFVPNYPCPLPMNIDSGLVVGLKKYSKEQLAVFMEIEHPEDPLHFPEKMMVMESTGENYATIGQFYNAIKNKIKELTDDTLPGDPSRQMISQMFDSSELFPILRKQDALKAIDIIVDQGEGTIHSPTDPEGELAHYYRFEELYKGKRLVRDKSSPNGYSFQTPIPFDDKNVFPISSNTKSKDFAPGTEERRMIDDFNNAYSNLLASLHRAFNGEPGFINNSMGLMFDIKLLGEKLAATKNPNNATENIGPSFEYI